MQRDYILYLKVGDQVFHKRYTRWGVGIVVEERTSELPGGFCYVRISFQDGKMRVFDNNFKSNTCCYYAGIQKIEEVCDSEDKGQRQHRIRKVKTIKAIGYKIKA